jgi:hypothetical protein
MVPLHGLLHGHLFGPKPAARAVFPIKIPGRLPVRISDFEASGLRHRFVFDYTDRHRAILLATVADANCDHACTGAERGWGNLT